MLRRIRAYFFTGLLIVVPIGVTLWIVWGIFQFMDNWFKNWIVQSSWWQSSLGDYVELPAHGVGFALTIIIICMIGFFASLYIGRQVLNLVDLIFLRIPGISTIYNGLKQISESIGGRQSQIFDKVVMVQYPRKGLWALAFVTAEDEGVFQPVLGEGMLYIFLPTTPNPTSGFFLIVPHAEAVELDISVEDAMKLIISSGMVSPKRIRATSNEQITFAGLTVPSNDK